MIRRTLASFAWVALLVGSALAQPQIHKPVGVVHPAARPIDQVTALAVGGLDRAAIAAEDAARDAAGFAPRFAIPNPVQATPATDGTWDLLDATWALWRLRVKAPGSDHVNLGFTRYFLPVDAQLMVYGIDGAHVVRPFTADDNSASRELWTPIVFHHEVVVELLVRATDIGQVDLTLGQVSSGYRFFGAGATAGPQTDASGSCNIDVICTQGDPWRNEIPAIAAYSTGGSVFCTGFMVNNTAQDARNFFMTAYHCGISNSNASSIVVYWDYENTTCNGGGATLSRFNTGSTFRSRWSTSDFALVELNSAPNPAWGVTYVGWDRTGIDATTAVAIHHPSGDAKKISFEYQSTSVTSYGGTSVPGAGTHVRVTDWDLGTTEGGSSGSPLFDQNHRVIGQLHGGGAACGNDLSDWYGRFSLSWTGGGTSSTRLSDWLDPLNTGTPALDTLGGGPIALATPFGVGCVEGFATFAESFSSTTFDLAGAGVLTNSIQLVPTSGGGYQVIPGSNAWHTPTSADLSLSDDDLSPVLNLPFPFVHPGGSTNLVRLCSNGYIWLDSFSTGEDYTPSIGELVTDPARLCPLWMDLNPARGGTTHYDVYAGVAYLTWLGVPEYSETNSNDVQCAIFPTGVVEFRWRTVTNLSHTAIVGYSPGNNAAQPASMDLSSSLPFTTAPDNLPLTLTPGSRPILGTTQILTVRNIPVGSLAGSMFLGFGQYAQGIDLSVIGMPDCNQYITLDSGTPFPTASSSYGYQLPIPPNTALVGGHVYAQAITVSPGFNTLGILTSNGVDLLLDQN